MTDSTKAPDAVAQAVLAAEEARQKALIRTDIAALDAMFDDDIVHIHAPGLSQNKAQLLEHTATRSPYLEITRGELTVRAIGDVAVLTGPITNRLRTKEGGERTLSGEVTQVLRRVDGRWLFWSFQMTPYGEQAWPSLPSEEQDRTKKEDGR